jgi:flagellar export protein FliJ
MKRHAFPLGRVLDWKTVVAQQEQTKLDALEQKGSDIQTSLLALDEAIKGLCDASQKAESGHELACTARARSAVQRQRSLAEQDHASCQEQIVAQQQRFRTAETERKLFDKLRERSRSEWAATMNRETDAQASDLYLGVWNRK